MKTSVLLPVSDETVKVAAEIIGQHSAAAKALMDADRRRQAGETVEFFKAGNTIFVRGTPANAA